MNPNYQVLKKRQFSAWLILYNNKQYLVFISYHAMSTALPQSGNRILHLSLPAKSFSWCLTNMLKKCHMENILFFIIFENKFKN